MYAIASELEGCWACRWAAAPIAPLELEITPAPMLPKGADVEAPCDAKWKPDVLGAMPNGVAAAEGPKNDEDGEPLGNAAPVKAANEGKGPNRDVVLLGTAAAAENPNNGEDPKRDGVLLGVGAAGKAPTLEANAEVVGELSGGAASGVEVLNEDVKEVLGRVLAAALPKL